MLFMQSCRNLNLFVIYAIFRQILIPSFSELTKKMLITTGGKVGLPWYNCSTVQDSAVYWNAINCSTVECSLVQFNTVQYSAVQPSAVQPGAVQCKRWTVQCTDTISPWPLPDGWMPLLALLTQTQKDFRKLFLEHCLKFLAHCLKSLDYCLKSLEYCLKGL